jgi:hypothetical protein
MVLCGLLLLLPVQHGLECCCEAVAVWLIKEGEAVCDASCCILVLQGRTCVFILRPVA